MSWIKKITWLFLYFIYIVVSVFLLLEIFFRFLPVSDSLEVMSVNEDNPIIHFQPNRTVTRQIGFNFNHVNEKRINNFGYATDIDFKATKPKEGKVVAVGSGARTEDGKIIPMDVKVGDLVLFGKWSGTEVKIDGKEYSIMKESDIMGISKGKK